MGQTNGLYSLLTLSEMIGNGRGCRAATLVYLLVIRNFLTMLQDAPAQVDILVVKFAHVTSIILW